MTFWAGVIAMEINEAQTKTAVHRERRSLSWWPFGRHQWNGNESSSNKSKTISWATPAIVMTFWAGVNPIEINQAHIEAKTYRERQPLSWGPFGLASMRWKSMKLKQKQQYIVLGARYRDDLWVGINGMEMNQAQTKAKAYRERCPLSWWPFALPSMQWKSSMIETKHKQILKGLGLLYWNSPLFTQ